MLTTETIKLWRSNALIKLAEVEEDEPGCIAEKAILALTAELLANREAQPVAVTDEMALAFHRALNDGGIGESDLEEIKVGLRGALCNVTAPPQREVRPDDKPFGYYSKETAAILERRGFAPISANPLVDHDMPLYATPPAPANAQSVTGGEYGDAYQGTREDLAIWKRRALEAEDKVRHLERINDHLVKEAQGEHRMGEPVLTAPPAPANAQPVAWSGWACQYPGKMPRLYGDKAIAEINCDYSNGGKLLFLSSALPALAVPDGWVMVPFEPTRKMMSQGHFAMGGTDRGKFRRIYQAMVAAAPGAK